MVRTLWLQEHEIVSCYRLNWEHMGPIFENSVVDSEQPATSGGTRLGGANDPVLTGVLAGTIVSTLRDCTGGAGGETHRREKDRAARSRNGDDRTQTRAMFKSTKDKVLWRKRACERYANRPNSSRQGWIGGSKEGSPRMPFSL